MVARAELAALLLLVAAVCATAGFRPGPPPVTEDTLEKVAASLEMYVDVLPQMPKVLGYSISKHGRPTPTHLTIGMYQKKWVYILFIYSFHNLYLSIYIYISIIYICISCVSHCPKLTFVLCA